MSKPQTFPDASIGGSSKQSENLFDEIFSGKNVNSALKAITGVGVKQIPAVGALLSGLVSALWPDNNKNRGIVWSDLEAKIESIASGLIDKNNSERMRDVTEGLYNVMKLYLKQAAGTDQKGYYFSSVMSNLEHDEPIYFNDKTPWSNLAYFASVGTLHLTILREQHLFYSDIYGQNDPQAAEHQKDLEDYVQKYLIRRNQMISKCLAWYKTQIKEDWHETNSGYWNSNKLNYKDNVRKVDEPFHWSENDDFIGKKKFACRKKQFETWVETGYRAQVEALLSSSFSWPLYSPNPRIGLAGDQQENNPANVVEGDVTNTTVRRLMMDYPGWIGDGMNRLMQIDEPYYFNQEDMFKKYGPITKIIVHAGDRIDGLEIFYGEYSASVRGIAGGSQHEVLEVKPGEMITGLWANDYDNDKGLAALKLRTTNESGTVKQTIQAGREAWITKSGWKYSFDGHDGGLQNDDTKRLLWFCGWSISSGPSGFVFRLLPVFGHYQTWGPLR